MFASNQVVPLRPLQPDEEKLVDQLLKDITIEKTKSWCG